MFKSKTQSANIATGLRRRFSYANVIATLALFFALTGASMAGVRYLTDNDQIASGDLAGSTYGSPVIAAGKVTGEKIADGAIKSSNFDRTAVAPDSVLFSGHQFADFPIKVSEGAVFRDDWFFNPNECSTLPMVVKGANLDPNTDFVIAWPAPGATGTVAGSVKSAAGGPVVELKLCAPADPDPTNNLYHLSGTYHYVVLR